MTVPAKEKEEIIEEQPYSGEPLPEGVAVQFSAQYEAESEEVAQPKSEPDEPEAQYVEQTQLGQEEITRRDREILAALDEVLQRNSAQKHEPNLSRRTRTGLRDRLVCAVRSGSGVLSLALTMIFMGIVLVCVMASPQPDYLLIAKLSPIAAVILGVELLLTWFVNGKQLRVNIPCVGIIAAIVAGCCILSAALNRSNISAREAWDDRVVEAEIYDASYKQLRHWADILELDVNVELIPGDKQKTMESLSTGDKVEISAVLDGNYADPGEFAEECYNIIGVYRDLNIPVADYHFSAHTRLSSFSLDVKGLFQQDMSALELTSLVRHIYLEDYDYIQDLEDFIEETAETSEKTIE